MSTAPIAQGPVDVNVRPVVSMTPGEVTAIINNPHGLRLLMDWQDFQHCQAESMLGPGDIEPWPTARFTALRDKGRAIIAEDPELWDDDIKRAFGLDGPNDKAQGAGGGLIAGGSPGATGCAAKPTK